MAEGGGGQIPSRSGKTTSPDPFEQEAGDSVGIVSLTSDIQCMRKGNGIRGKRESPGDVEETGGRRETYEGHVRRYFGGGKGAEETGIRQGWQG